MTLDATIHVIDDDSAMRESLSLMLTIEGYTVRTHESARTFLDAIGQDESGCVVTDVIAFFIVVACAPPSSSRARTSWRTLPMQPARWSPSRVASRLCSSLWD